MGNDYYVTNEHLVFPDGRTQASGEIFGYYVITQQYYRRYKLPIMHTETNIKMPACSEWLIKQWANLHRLKQRQALDSDRKGPLAGLAAARARDLLRSV